MAEHNYCLLVPRYCHPFAEYWRWVPGMSGTSTACTCHRPGPRQLFSWLAIPTTQPWSVHWVILAPDLADVDRWKRKWIGRGGEGKKWNYAEWTINFIVPQKSCLALMPWTTLNHAARMRDAQSILQCSVPQNALDSIYMERTCPGLKGYPPSWDNLSECLCMRKKLTPLPELTVLAHALIVSPWLNCMEKSWAIKEGDPTITKGSPS